MANVVLQKGVDSLARLKPYLSDKRILVALGATLLVIVVLALWPTGKPPEPCPGGNYLPGQLVEQWDPQAMRAVQRVIDSDCKPSAQPATPEETKAALSRMAKWQAYEREHPAKGPESSMMGGMLSAFVPLGLQPFLWFFGVVFALWGILLTIALFMFLVGFLVVAVFGLRHAPLLVILAPVMVWWKILIEIPKQLCLQLIDASLAKAETTRLQGKSWHSLLHLLGFRELEAQDSLGDLGSASFAAASDIHAKNAPGEKKSTIDVGMVEGAALNWNTDKHVLILAGTRAGKGRDIIIPNLLRYPGSVFVVDPKAGNLKDTVRYRIKVGAVRVLDPWGKTGIKPGPALQRFNPVRLLSRERPESVDVADTLAHALVLPSGGDEHWSMSARALWKALLLHVATAEEFEGRRDLVTARQVLLAGFLPAKKATDKNPDTGEKQEDAPEPSTIEQMIENDAFDSIIADFAMSLLATPEEERGSIISNAVRQTDFLDTPALRTSLAENGEGTQIDFSEWRRGIMSCYVCIPSDKLEGSGLRWVRLVVAAALNEMLREEAPPAMPVQFILDELAALKRLEPVERAVGLAAGYGVQVWAVWQDLAQMRDLYQSRWASFIGNAGVRYVFGLGDYDTAKYFSDYMGLATRMVNVRQTDGVGFRVSGMSQSVQTRPLMTPDELMVMGDREMVVLLDGMRPLKSTRTAWYEDATLKARSEGKS